MIALLVFIMATLEIVFWAKKSYSTESVFGSNLLQKSAGYICNQVCHSIKQKIVPEFSLTTKKKVTSRLSLSDPAVDT